MKLEISHDSLVDKNFLRFFWRGVNLDRSVESFNCRFVVQGRVNALSYSSEPSCGHFCNWLTFQPTFIPRNFHELSPRLLTFPFRCCNIFIQMNHGQVDVTVELVWTSDLPAYLEAALALAWTAAWPFLDGQLPELHGRSYRPPTSGLCLGQNCSPATCCSWQQWNHQQPRFHHHRIWRGHLPILLHRVIRLLGAPPVISIILLIDEQMVAHSG